ncbi:hypothetical protein [Hoeflea sp.]|uniref:hypothetical protein n=1 Tax=Hoeflea sp. TaxID=1940281 RepID=UPI003B01F235
MYILPSWNSLNSKNEHYNLIKPLVRMAYLDVEFYAKKYADLAGLSDRELIHHYVEHGYREGRLSWDYKVDPVFMRLKYSDLNNLSDQQITDHYHNFGYGEGRLPYMPHLEKEFYLKTYGHELALKGIGQSEEELHQHFVNAGYLELMFPYRFWCK